MTCRARPHAPHVLDIVPETTPEAGKCTPGRPFWPSKDPIEEAGGINLYATNKNDTISRFDILGLAEGQKLSGVEMEWRTAKPLLDGGFEGDIIKRETGNWGIETEFCEKDQKTYCWFKGKPGFTVTFYMHDISKETVILKINHVEIEVYRLIGMQGVNYITKEEYDKAKKHETNHHGDLTKIYNGTILPMLEKAWGYEGGRQREWVALNKPSECKKQLLGVIDKDSAIRRFDREVTRVVRRGGKRDDNEKLGSVNKDGYTWWKMGYVDPDYDYQYRP
jgi:hypothetical protein